MSETDTYYRYREDRVLLSWSQISRPTASACWIHLTGAQVEMLRNMTQYLNRPNTYVWEYEIDKYLTPNADNFDDIQAQVANLEEKLMGNENTLWGFAEEWDEDLGGTATGATYEESSSAVPAGEVWVLQACSIRNNTRAMTGVSIDISRGSGASVFLAYAANVAQFAPLLAGGMYALVTGDLVNLYAGATQAGDVIKAGVVGYKMAIPT